MKDKIVAIISRPRYKDKCEKLYDWLSEQGYYVLMPNFNSKTGRANVEEIDLKRLDIADIVYIVNPSRNMSCTTLYEISRAIINGCEIRRYEDWIMR